MSVSVAVDVGSHYIKVVEGFSKKDKIIIKTAAITRNPFPNAHLSLNENTQKQFAVFLRDFISKIGVKKRETICSITGQDVIIHYFDIPDVPENEIKSIIDLELLQIIPGGAEKLEYDYTILPSHNSGKKTIMLAGLPKQKCDFFVNTLIMAGLKPIIMDIGSIALVNCYLTLSKEKVIPLIINAGASHTDMAIVDQDGFVFVREIDFGGDLVNREITRLKKISLLEAEQLKRSGLFNNEIEKIVKDISFEAMQEILTSLKYFETRTGKKIEKFLLTGGSSRLPGFIKIIEDSLGIPGEMWVPMKNLYQHCKTDEPECAEVCFTPALGLVVRKLV
ncbi:MAG: pilus assembly protein PilM [Candidatus Omnitrophica bacterium]|nr:pilus assembly protein PilM [Candidatus Omnitrophota bacterium]MCM8817595.1 pilus assembly protein PilM [Candidatus Omnitrophota bacterium]